MLTLFAHAVVCASSACASCKQAVRGSMGLRNIIRGFNSTIPLCESLNSSARAKCRRAAELYSQSILDTSIQDETSICIGLNLCRPPPVPLAEHRREEQTIAHLSEESSGCDFCKVYLDYLFNEGAHEHGKVLGMKIVKEACPMLRTSEAICDDIDEHSVEKMLMFISTKFSSVELCQAAGMCYQGAPRN